MRHPLRFLSTLLGLAALTACGGGSDGGNSAPPATSFNASLQGTSYNNFKAMGLQPTLLPQGVRFGGTRAYADFFGTGRTSLFSTRLTYDIPTTTPATASAAVFEFWERQTNGSLVPVPTKIAGGTGCIHPRKSLVADFNNDGRPDIAVACHGYDGSPFPGERMKLVLSEADGRYRILDAAPDVGFFHGAAAGDIDGDGWIDLIAVNSMEGATAVVFLNNRAGGFVRENASRLPGFIAGKQYFTVELMDVDGDGKADLFFGGHEWERGSTTVVLINPGNGNFAGVTPTALPFVPNNGVVLDATATGSGSTRALWVLRTSGGDGTFYRGRVMQRLSWPGLASSTPFSDRATAWTPWVIPATIGGTPSLVSDDVQDGVVVAQ